MLYGYRMTVFERSGKYYIEEYIQLPDLYPNEIIEHQDEYPQLYRYLDMIRVITRENDDKLTGKKFYPFIIPPKDESLFNM